MLVKKNVVLQGTNDKNKKAILSLECDGYETTGSVRLYGFTSEPLGIISLGIFADGKVEKAGLTRVENMLYKFACNIKSLPEDFSCAVVNFSQGELVPVLFGNSQGSGRKEEVFDSVVLALNETKSVKDVEKILDEHNIEYDDNLKEEIEHEIDKCTGKCEECVYKKYYFENVKNQAVEDEETSEKLEDTAEGKQEKINAFYSEIKKQIDDLFDNNPEEEYLASMLPNSKWVKVKVDEFGNYYVIGLIYEQESLKYICYGVPGVFQEIPPRQLSGFPVWFPLDEHNPQSFGYWLSYQDADSGESVKAVLI
ncbi:MAG: hypothetical protein J6A28_01090 [Clostridia bacterium]|nr:hypothetical protein [Clostridia bacterium]